LLLTTSKSLRIMVNLHIHQPSYKVGLSMEVRKVQESAGTLFISLPKNWVVRNNVSKGARLTVIERGDGSLTVTPGYKIGKVTQTASVQLSPFLEREITSKYWLGYDVITVESKERLRLEDLERIKAVVRRLIGLEIVEEDARTVQLQCLLEPSAFPPEKILRREYLLVASMQRDLVTCLLEVDPHLAETIIERDDEVDRLYFLLVRVLRTLIQHPALSEELHFSPINCLDYRLVASFVESIADQLVTITQHLLPRLSTIPENVRIEFKETFPAVLKLHEDAIHAFLSKDYKLANNVRELRGSILRRVKDTEIRIAQLPLEEFIYLATVLSALTKTVDYSVDIADMVIPS